MPKTSLIVAICFILIQISHSLYCMPYCSGACLTSTKCSAGCITPFSYQPTAANTCYVDNSTIVISDGQLISSTAFVASGYSSNTALATSFCADLTPQTYYYLGPYVANNYVFKTLSGIGTNHYRVNVFWSYGIFGTWSGQQLSAIFTDGNGAVTQLLNQGQNCVPYATFTSCVLLTGCFNNYNLQITHSTDSLSFNFSSMGSAMSTSSSIQAWGVKDLYVVVSLCNVTCLTCSGPTSTNCLTCPLGTYLQGSVCILLCPFYTMPSSRLCVTSCPAYYYVNTLNNYCEICPNNCQTCINSTDCVTWDSGQDPTDNLLLNYLSLWIILIVIGVVLIGILLWKLCCSKKTFYDTMEEEVIDHNGAGRQKKPEINYSTQQIQPEWVKDIDDFQMTKMQNRRSKNPGFIQGIGKELNNTK